MHETRFNCTSVYLKNICEQFTDRRTSRLEARLGVDMIGHMRSAVGSPAIGALVRRMRPVREHPTMTRASHDSFARLNIYKDSAQAPTEKVGDHDWASVSTRAHQLTSFGNLQQDSEYPEWLWTLLEPKETREALTRKVRALYEAGGYDAVFEGMNDAELTRLFRLDARQRIKDENERRRGGRIV